MGPCWTRALLNRQGKQVKGQGASPPAHWLNLQAYERAALDFKPPGLVPEGIARREQAAHGTVARAGELVRGLLPFVDVREAGEHWASNDLGG